MKKLISLALVMLMVLALNVMVVADNFDQNDYQASSKSISVTGTYAIDYGVSETLVYGATIYWTSTEVTNVPLEAFHILYKWNPETTSYDAIDEGESTLESVINISVKVVNKSNGDITVTVGYDAPTTALTYFSGAIAAAEGSDLSFDCNAWADSGDDHIGTAETALTFTLIDAAKTGKTKDSNAIEQTSAIDLGSITVTIAAKS